MTEEEKVQIAMAIAGAVFGCVGIALLIWFDWRVGLGVALAWWSADINRNTSRAAPKQGKPTPQLAETPTEDLERDLRKAALAVELNTRALMLRGHQVAIDAVVKEHPAYPGGYPSLVVSTVRRRKP